MQIAFLTFGIISVNNQHKIMHCICFEIFTDFNIHLFQQFFFISYIFIGNGTCETGYSLLLVIMYYRIFFFFT